MASIDKIKIGNSTYDITASWSSITDKPSSFTPANHNHTKSEVGLGNVDNTADANKSVKYANSAGSVAWNNISSKPITITQRNNDSPVSGAYAYGTYVTMRNTNNWFEIYAPHMGTSSSRVYMQTGWDDDRQGWKAIAWTSDIPTSLPASDVYDWAKASTKPSYSWSEINNKPTTFPPESHTHNYLPLNGSNAMTGTITLPENSTSLKFRSDSVYETGTFYGTAGNEALTFYTASAQTSFQFINDSKPTASNSWQGITPGLQIKNNKVIINKQLGDGTSSDYNLEVNGSMYASSITTPGILDLKNSANGIKFNSKAHYVTNIQIGQTSLAMNSVSNGSTRTVTVTFDDYFKGEGYWYIVATTRGESNSAVPDSIVVSVTELTPSGFTIKARKVANATGSGGSPYIYVHYIAIKYS